MLSVAIACRPLKYEGAHLLVTAETRLMARSKLLLGLAPQDDTTATASVLTDSLELCEVDIEEIEVS